MKRTYLLIFFICFSHSRIRGEYDNTDYYGFLVEDEAPNKFSQTNNGVLSRKALVPAANHHGALKPAPRGMGMTFQPVHKQQGGLSMGVVHYTRNENANKRLHIAPTINLAQTLNTLDKIGKANRRTIHDGDVNKMALRQNITHKAQNNSITPQNNESLALHAKIGNATNILNSTQYKLPNRSDAEQQHNMSQSLLSDNSNTTETDAASNVTKKDARPNLLTDSPIKGFLAKDVNFTIHDVGKQSEVKNKESEHKNQKLLTLKGSQEAKSNAHLQNSSTSEVLTMSLLKPSNASELESQPAKLINTTSAVKSEALKSSSSVANATKRKVSSLRKSSAKLHLVSADDFVKLRPTQPRNISIDSSVSALKKDKIDSAWKEAECNEDKKCPKNKYCRHFACYECHRKHHECIEDDQCCDEMPCVYGRCDEKPKGSPGTICDKDGDCGDGCCIIEPTIDEEHGICKNKLDEYHQCSPVLFRKVWVGDEKPKCGPCKDGFECMEKGVLASHLVCMKKKG